MSENLIWVLKGEPNSVKIVDKDGVERLPDLDKVRKYSRLKPGLIAGRYGRGVGGMFYGGRLGNKSELTAQGNVYTTNDSILGAIGYVKESQAS